MAERLTKKKLDALRRWAEAHPDRQREVHDAEIPGFYARARRGYVEFYIRETKGRRTRRRLGSYGPVTLEKARDQALDVYNLTRKGQTLAEQRRDAERDQTTFADAAKAYLADLLDRAEKGARRGRRSSHGSARRRLERNVLPKLGGLPVAGVEAGDVQRLHRAMHETPGEANRTLGVVSAVLGFAERRGWRPAGSNPCRTVERFEESGQRRRLTAEELRRLGEAMREAEAERSEQPAALLAMRLFALTGMRRSEVLGHEAKARRVEGGGLRWGDLDLEAGTVRLRQTKTGTQTRQLGRAVVELLRSARPESAAPGDPVCPGEVDGQPFIGIDKVRQRLYEAAGIDGADLHSLRHTFASIGADLGLAAHVSALLGHAVRRTGSVTDRYLHDDPALLRKAADRIAAAVAALLEGETGELVEFPGSSGGGHLTGEIAGASPGTNA